MTIETNKSAGDDVDSRCLKCKDVTNHTVIAMTGDTIAKVQCNTCGARHNYRPPVAEKKKTSSIRRRRDGKVTVSSTDAPKTKKSKSPTKKALREVADFDDLIRDKDVSTAIPYALDATLTVGDVVDHSLFGLGIVTELKPLNKAYIAFREHGTKLMACKLAE
ncbi:MAG: hypothetical protein KQH63_08630 [Desulfobulbaceae bacterium]|nr:hypothetical protein [Desulfobulbaceae bacterium]